MDKARAIIVKSLMKIKDAFSLPEKPSAGYLDVIINKFHEDHWFVSQVNAAVDALISDREYAEAAKYGRYPTYADFSRVRAELALDAESTADYPMPHTEIDFIQDVFLDVCRFIHREGIIWVEYCAKVEKIPYGNKMFLRKITNANGTVEEILANKEWILDDLIKSKEDTFPDFYFKFPGMRKMEKYAFAHKLGVFTIKK